MIHPGEILLEEYLKPMKISQNAMARAIGVAPRAINEIVLGRRSITPRMSIKFGTFFTQSDQFWHGLQVDHDFRQLNRDQIISGVEPYTKEANKEVFCMYVPGGGSMKKCRSCGKPSKRVQCDKCRNGIAKLGPIADAIRNKGKPLQEEK